MLPWCTFMGEPTIAWLMILLIILIICQTEPFRISGAFLPYKVTLHSIHCDRRYLDQHSGCFCVGASLQSLCLCCGKFTLWNHWTSYGSEWWKKQFGSPPRRLDILHEVQQLVRLNCEVETTLSLSPRLPLFLPHWVDTLVLLFLKMSTYLVDLMAQFHHRQCTSTVLVWTNKNSVNWKANNTWELLSVVGTSIQSRYGHSTISRNETLFVFGGQVLHINLQWNKQLGSEYHVQWCLVIQCGGSQVEDPTCGNWKCSIATLLPFGNLCHLWHAHVWW